MISLQRFIKSLRLQLFNFTFPPLHKLGAGGRVREISMNLVDVAYASAKIAQCDFNIC